MLNPKALLQRLRIGLPSREKIARGENLRGDLHSVLVHQIGFMTVGWATMEMSLDYMISIAHRNGGSDAIQRDHPASLKVKLAYLRKMPRNVPELSHLDLDFGALVDGIQAQKTLRHALTHGVPMIQKSDDKVLIVGYTFAGGKLNPSNRIVSQDEISALTKRVLGLTLDAACLGMSVAKALGEGEDEDTFRKLAVSAALSIKLSDER